MDTLVFFGSITAIVVYIAYSRHKERMEMIRKGINPVLFAKRPNPATGNTTLFIGLVIFAIGLALLVGAIFVQRYFDRGMMTASMVNLFAGGAMLLYWKLTAKDRENARRLYEEHLARETEEYSLPDDKEEKSESQDSAVVEKPESLKNSN